MVITMESLPIRKNLPHNPPSWVRDSEIFFVTICARNRELRPFLLESAAQTLMEAARNYHIRQRWWLRLFLVMPDHVHALLAFPPDRKMRTTLATWKSYTAKATGMPWQQDFFDHRPRNLSALVEKETYILHNPVRWGLVAKPEEWPWLLRQQDLPRWREPEPA